MQFIPNYSAWSNSTKRELCFMRVAAAVLSQRYIADRFLPDKAIDLVDEAAARLRTEIESLPVELDEVQRRGMQLEIEQAERAYDLNRAAELRYGKLQELERRLQAEEELLAKK
jgi:ATP-dependent Clp protease ATP-binding subunit ClpB